MVWLDKEMLQRFEYKISNYFLFEKLLQLFVNLWQETDQLRIGYLYLTKGNIKLMKIGCGTPFINHTI